VNQEKQDFPGPTATTYTDTRSSEHYYAASFYNASTGLHYSTKLTGQQGPTKTILAQRGDKIDLSVYAAYLSPAGTVTNSFAPVLLPLSATSRQNTVAAPATETAKPVTGLARALSNLSVGVAIPFGQTTQRTMATQGLPQAALQYVILKADDNSPVANGTGTVLVDANGQGNWEQLQLSVTITQNYPVKVVISTQNYDGTQPVYFDDLTVNYTAGPIVEENHYYAYGQRNEGLSWRRTDERLYGRGYQGQNTTQDAESGYTAFDLRLYDARYGRWLATDPKKQYKSPYISMGNNPISMVDRDGGLTEYGIDNKTGTTYTLSDLGGDEVDFIRHGDFSNDFSTFAATSTEIVIHSLSLSKTMGIADKATLYAGLYHDIKTEAIESLSQHLDVITNFTNYSKFRTISTVIGVGLGTVGVMKSGYDAYQHPNLGNYAKFTWDVGILVLSPIAPELGIADGLLDAAGYKDQFFNGLTSWGNSHNFMAEPARITPFH